MKNTKIKFLKKFGLIKWWFNDGLNGKTVYQANTRNPLFWILYALFWMVVFIPTILFGMFSGGIKECAINNHEWFKHQFEVNEPSIKLTEEDLRKAAQMIASKTNSVGDIKPKN